MASKHCIAIYETAEGNGSRLQKLEPSLRKAAEGQKHSCTIEILSYDKHQKLYGFGGGISESSAYLLSGLPEEKRLFILNSYYRDSCYTLGRTPLNSSDFSPESWAVSDRSGHFSTERSDRCILPVLKKASDITSQNLWLMVSPWSPPAYMKTNGSMYGGGKLKKECYGEWARIFARYLAHLKENGLNVWACSVQNECESVRPWETCLYTAEEETEFIDGFLYEALSAYGLQDTKIFIWDHNRDGLYRRMRDSLRNSAGHIAGAAYHWYSGAFYDNVRRCREEFPDMDLLFTEGCIEKPAPHDAWYPGERYAHNIINDLNNGCNGWIDWNIVLDSKGGPNHAGGACDAPVIIDEDGEIRFHSSYYAISHFSRFIMRSARILGTKLVSGRIPSAPDGVAADLIEATAAENPDGTIALVLLNRTSDEISLSIKLNGTESSFTCPAHALQTMIFND